jgi:hypothetical protein
MSFASIREIALDLPMKDRAALIDQLIESIDTDVKKADREKIEKRWAAESEERIDALRRGELKSIDGPSALAELRRAHE